MQNWSRYISRCLVTKAGTTPDISSRGFNTENCLQNFWKGKRSRMKIFDETPTNMLVTLSLESCSWSPQSPPHDAVAATRGTTKAERKKRNNFFFALQSPTSTFNWFNLTGNPLGRRHGKTALHTFSFHTKRDKETLE